MCCLFGFYNYSGQSIKDLSRLTNSLAEEATVALLEHKAEILKKGEQASSKLMGPMMLLLIVILILIMLPALSSFSI